MKLFWVLSATLSAMASAISEEQTPFTVSANDQFDLPAHGIAKLLQIAKPVDESSAAARFLEDEYAADGANDSLSKYSIQFQGCHHIQQWNDEADEDGDVKISTTRLVRFRLVPYQQCQVVSPWASSSSVQALRNSLGGVDYGEYIVDLNSFVESYIEAKEEECYYDGNCSNLYGSDDDAGNGISIADYVQCAQFDFEYGDDAADDDNDANNQAFYFGPYCASQGGEIRFNLFEDDSCTTVSKCGNKYGSSNSRGSACYTKQTGEILPFTQSSIITDPCISCSENYATLIADGQLEDSEIDYSDYDFGYARDVCSYMYKKAGKCETYMSDGQYDGACSYIAGIQMGVNQDGYAVAIRRSLPADAVMGTMVIASTFIGMYVYYLKYLLDTPSYKGNVLLAR